MSVQEWNGAFKKSPYSKKSGVFMSVSVFFYSPVAFLHLDDQGSFFEIGNFTNLKQCVSLLNIDWFTKRPKLYVTFCLHHIDVELFHLFIA
jgi:hypothetical protein